MLPRIIILNNLIAEISIILNDIPEMKIAQKRANTIKHNTHHCFALNL